MGVFEAGKNYVGYCSSYGHIVTDNEKIWAAVKNHQDKVMFDRDHEGYSYIKYTNSDEFFLKNPNCCYVHYDEDYAPERGSTLMDRLTGYYGGTAVIKYRAYYRDKDGSVIDELKLGMVYLTNCNGIRS